MKTVRFREPKYVGDPINAVKIFNEKEVDELVFLDITASVEGRSPDMKRIKEIAGECFMPLGYGGGVRSLDVIRELFNCGVEKVIINSYSAENPSFIRQATDLYGSQSIIVSIDVKKSFFGRNEVFTAAGSRNTKRDPVEFARLMEEMGAGEIFLNSIDRDGTMAGYDVELVRKVTAAVSIPVVACGGAGSIEDCSRVVREGGASAAAAGSIFVFQGRHRAVLITYPDQQELKSLHWENQNTSTSGAA